MLKYVEKFIIVCRTFDMKREERGKKNLVNRLKIKLPLPTQRAYSLSLLTFVGEFTF
jgi:hypothetical protein